MENKEEQLLKVVEIKLHLESWGASHNATSNKLYVKCLEVINKFIHNLSTDNWSVIITPKKACLKCCIKKALFVYNEYYKDNTEFTQLLLDLQELDKQYQNNI